MTQFLRITRKFYGFTPNDPHQPMLLNTAAIRSIEPRSDPATGAEITMFDGSAIHTLETFGALCAQLTTQETAV